MPLSTIFYLLSGQPTESRGVPALVETNSFVKFLSLPLESKLKPLKRFSISKR